MIQYVGEFAMRLCKKCGQNKDISLFPKKSNCKDGYNTICKICINLHNKQYRDNNKEQFKNIRKKHSINNKDKIRIQRSKYTKKHADKKAVYDKKYRSDNREKIAKYKYNWEYKNRNDPIFKIRKNLRRRINHVLKGNNKSQHSFELIGCTAQEFKIYIESKFLPGMSWDNYGNKGWHIDHIKPCCTFDLSKPEEQRKCFHYTNQQPLWAEENLKKGRKIVF